MRKFLLAPVASLALAATAALLTGCADPSTAGLPPGMINCLWKSSDGKSYGSHPEPKIYIDCKFKDGSQVLGITSQDDCDRIRKSHEATVAVVAEQNARVETATPPAVKAMCDEIIRRLEQRKRQIWSTYNDMMAPIQTQGAWEAATHGVHAWYQRCVSGISELRNGPTLAECEATQSYLLNAVLAWNWSSPPR